jgi:hypothetical protein
MNIPQPRNSQVIGVFILVVILAISVSRCGSYEPDAPDNIQRIFATAIP